MIPAKQALPAAKLLALREEIGIFPGPTAFDGSPSWTLHDPSYNRFYRLGWREFEILSRWEAGTAEEVAGRVNVETTLRIEKEDVEELSIFLSSFNLLRATGAQATARMVEKAARLKEGVGQWLLHNYLFTRIPLLRPDRVLTAVYPYVRWVYSRAFALSIITIGMLGLYLIVRQWDSFLATFVDLFTLEGIVFFGITLSCLKTVHELGHGFTAKRFGCHVPTMGVALLVLVPVLYSDVNDAWKLTSRRQRLAIGSAGVTAELCCAAIATCAWGFLPNGPARSVAFLIATSTWVTTVLINLSPFMRYDGYFVLSDWLETPNLHTRSFALARWWMREKLLGLGEPAPEEFPARRRAFLIGFAYLTWIYRFSLFLGIAAIVYHFSIKILAIGMMIMEIGYFLVRPLYSEGKAWWERRADIRWGPRTLFTTAAAMAIVAFLLVPWRSGIEAPALLKSRQHIDLFVPDFGARIVSIDVENGDEVDKGKLLIRLVSPDIDYKIQQVRTDLDILEWRMGTKGLDADLLAHSRVTEQEYAAALAEYRGLLDQKARLELTAPVGGKVVDLAEGIRIGMWATAKSRMLSVVDPADIIAEGYVGEADLERIATGDKATFYAEADSRVAVALRVIEIARASTRMLPDPYLASINGGPITVRTPKQNELVPDRTLYRVTLAPAGDVPAPTHVVRGRVVLRGEAMSIAARAWRSFLAVVIRESGA